MFRLVLLSLLVVGCLGDPLPDITNRIVGGFEAHINQYPYQVSVNHQDNSGPICGGSLIAKKWVLTAAHCIFINMPYYIQTRVLIQRSLGVRVGSDAFKSGGEFYKVKKGYRHRSWNGWNPYNTDYDFGLLELEEEVTLSDKVQIIKLADAGEELPVGSCINVTGWGSVDSLGKNISQVLKGVQVQTMDQETCMERYSSFEKEEVTPRMFCSDQGPENACKGDSGGPAVHEGKQYGIVSWTRGCETYPIVYAKISAQRQWIRDISGV